MFIACSCCMFLTSLIWLCNNSHPWWKKTGVSVFSQGFFFIWGSADKRLKRSISLWCKQLKFPFKTTCHTFINTPSGTSPRNTEWSVCVYSLSMDLVRYSQEIRVSPPHWTGIMSYWSVEKRDSSSCLALLSPALICQLPACKMSYRYTPPATTLLIS